MVDNYTKGTPNDIATQGVSTPDGIGLGTQGFLEPVHSDIVLGGAAGVETSIVVSDLSTGGAASVSRSWSVTGDGGVVTGGIDPVGRGGTLGRKRKHKPGINFEYAQHEPEQSPMDYWNKIEKAIEQAKEDEKVLYKYTGSGKAVKLAGKSKLTVIHRDLPDSEVYVTSNFDISDKIKLELTSLYQNNQTQDEIIATDEMIIINDLLSTGSYDIKTGKKARYTHTSGSAGASFKPASAKATHFDFVDDLRKHEDEEFIFGQSSRNQEEEELELIGMLD